GGRGRALGPPLGRGAAAGRGGVHLGASGRAMPRCLWLARRHRPTRRRDAGSCDVSAASLPQTAPPPGRDSLGLRLRAWLDFTLAPAPGVYPGLPRRRRPVNLEKLNFLTLVRRGDVVLDAGASEGYYTLLFSHLVGRRGRVHAFEPLPPSFGVLAARLARDQRFDNVVANELAVAAAEG